MRASAIWPTAAAAWLSSSFSGPPGRPSTLRPSATEPEETTSTSAPRLCSAGDIVGERGEPVALHRAARAIDEQRRADLDDDAAELDELRHRLRALGEIHGRHSAALAGAAFVDLALGVDLFCRARKTSCTFCPRRGGQRERRCASPRASAAPIAVFRVSASTASILESATISGFSARPRAIGLDLVAHGLVGLARMFAAGIDEMQQNLAALDMAEKTVAEPGAFMRAFDEAGNVGEDEFAPVAGDDAKPWHERREGIVGDLRLGGGDRGEKGRFAGVGQADKPCVGDELQPQDDRALLAGSPGLARRGARLVEVLKCVLPKPPLPPLKDDDALADFGQVGDQRIPSAS